jgi:hypothetical protein
LGPLISCKDASRLISQLQDGNVSLGRRLLIRIHLLGCDACSRFDRQLSVLREAMRKYKE